MRDGRLERGAVGVALLAAAVISMGCGKAAERTAVQQRLRQKPVAAVMEEASRADYRPPADGRLSESQVEMYMEVRERAERIREVAAAAALEVRAAQELHRNPKEYLWVKARLLEAQTAEGTRALLRKMALGREQLVSRLRAERDQLTDPASRAEAAHQLAALERALAESEPAVPREVEANIRLLARYRVRLARLQQLEERTLVRVAAGVEGGAAGGGATAAVVATGAAGGAGSAGKAGAQEP